MMTMFIYYVYIFFVYKTSTTNEQIYFCSEMSRFDFLGHYVSVVQIADIVNTIFTKIYTMYVEFTTKNVIKIL